MSRRFRHDICDLFGRRLSVSHFRQGLTDTFSATAFDEPPPDTDVSSPDEGDERARTYLAVLDALARYEASGRFTQIELQTIRHVVLDGWTLEQIAASDGVTRQAIRERLVGNRRGHGGILKKAPEVAEYWHRKHGHRLRRKGQSCGLNGS